MRALGLFDTLITIAAAAMICRCTASAEEFKSARICKVERLILVNADTDQPIGPISSGETLELASLPTRNINIIAETDPQVVTRVIFDLNSSKRYRVESSAPYALAGDDGGNYRHWTPRIGSNTIVARPQLKDWPCSPLEVKFEVVARRLDPQAAPVTEQMNAIIPTPSRMSVAETSAPIQTPFAPAPTLLPPGDNIAPEELAPDADEPLASLRATEDTSADSENSPRVARYDFPLLAVSGKENIEGNGSCIARFDKHMKSLTVVCSHTIRDPNEAALLLIGEANQESEICGLGNPHTPFVHTCFLETLHIEALSAGRLYVAVAASGGSLLRGRISAASLQTR